MRKLGVALVSMLFSHSLLSQDLLQCLHPDVMQGLARSGVIGVGNAVVTRTIPAAMEGIEPPAVFELIASAVDSASTTVAFKAELPTPEAHELALVALESDGWEVQGGERTRIYYEGSANSPVPSVTTGVCRDGRRLTVGSRFIEGASYVNYHFGGALAAGSCGGAGGFAANLPSFSSANNLEQFMPSLRFPPDPATGNAVVARPAGTGGGGNSRYSTTQVSMTMPLGELAEFLGAQLGAAGWTADSTWAGSLTAGSTWTRAPAADSELMATLEVAARAPTIFDVTLRIIDLN